MFQSCIVCGHHIPYRSKFCSACGAKQDVNMENNVNDKNDMKCIIKESKTIYVYNRKTKPPKIWIWQEQSHECTKEMGFTWEKRPYMQYDINKKCWKFVIDDDFYNKNIPFNVIIDDDQEFNIK